ncbi:SycD/LcrH family type III secretion system chaperone [Achromobacter sp. NPDC058515]|uniref:SycD/LcrH family type III secretion system chaperone n=1 Tax=Achromobacter sp. NPDC058515 TaxID=3346533 RepID=UPI003661DF84
MSQREAPDFNARDFEEAASDLSALLRQGGTLGSGQGVTRPECEALYQLGHGLYEQGRYSDAFKAFSMLVIYDHLEPRYLMALGGASQMLDRYSDALVQYGAAAMISLDDPLPMFHSAECLVAMERLPEAAESLELALSLCVAEAHEPVRARAQALRHALLTRMQ